MKIAASSLLWLIGCLSITSPPPNTFAQENQTQNQQASDSKEQRKKMAKAHDDMAKCLKSNKPMSECHSQMMKGCPMCAHMGHEHGGMMCE